MNDHQADLNSPESAAAADERNRKGGPRQSLSRLKSFHFHSIRTRGIAVSTGLVLITVIVAVSAYTLSLQAYYLSAARAALQAKAETASSFFADYINRTYAEYYQSAYNYAESFEDRDSLELQFIDTNGRIEISSTSLSTGIVHGSDDVQSALSYGRISVWQGRHTSTGEKIMAVSSPLISADGTVVGVMRYITSLKLIDRAVSSAALMSGGIGLAVVLIVFFSNLYFIRTITVPIASLTAMARRIAEGSYGAKVAKEHDDEIGELTDAINDMSQKLSRAERLQTEFISSVSHELRTPLTAITGWSETLGYDDAIRGDSRRGIEIISREAARLTKMVEELLEFTRIQDGRFTLQVSTVDFPSLVEECMYTYNELFRKENIAVNYFPSEDDIPEIPGDPERLKQVVLNILDNACKYGKSGKRIDVSVGMDDNSVYTAIRDYGPGIPPNELPQVKKKFFKGSSKERGSGIGLAVCDEIVARHNGILDIVNAPGGGVCVTITLPKKP
ncbi:MAG: HAMP domain-containing histidine kinase [Oscillospiraceae bacterium]|nr:HAMP domain-containing histidine kinase [Oscillospiraceae bacterium]